MQQRLSGAVADAGEMQFADMAAHDFVHDETHSETIGADGRGFNNAVVLLDLRAAIFLVIVMREYLHRIARWIRRSGRIHECGEA